MDFILIPDGADAEARELQAKLRDEKIPQHLSDDNTIEYPIEWTDDGKFNT